MKKIMLIEDDQVMVDLLITLLQIEGFDVEAIDFSMNSIDVLRQNDPDVILLDVNLRRPDGTEINGFSILEEIRKDDLLENSKVIMSSGIDFKEKSVAAGANGFILKPYMPDALINLIKQVCD
jgi:CheY-like chemotaxis protein